MKLVEEGKDRRELRNFVSFVYYITIMMTLLDQMIIKNALYIG